MIKRPDIGNRTILDENTFNDGIKVRHWGWTLFWTLATLSVLGLVGGVIVQGTDFFLYKTFAPRMEDARREVFEGSKAYHQGMIQQLQAYQMSYQTATDEQKVGLRASILSQTADYPINELRERNPQLASWLTQLRSGGM